MKDRIFYQSDSSGNVGAHDIKGSHEIEKGGTNQHRQQQQQATKEGIPWEIRIKQSQQIYAMIFHGGFQKHVALPI